MIHARPASAQNGPWETPCRHCPHCGLVGAAYRLRGKKQRCGLYKCKGCEDQFTVTVGTVFERSHIPLNKWILAPDRRMRR